MRLATWNILHGRSMSDATVDIDRFARAIATLDADVLALQEVDRNATRSGRSDEAAEVAAVAGLSCAFAEATSFEPGSAYGNALLVRGDLGEVDVLALPGEEGDPVRRLLAVPAAGRRPPRVRRTCQRRNEPPVRGTHRRGRDGGEVEPL